MLKKIFILLSYATLFATENSGSSSLPTAKTVIKAGGIAIIAGAASVVLAPYVLPAGTVAAIKVAATVAAAKTAAAGAALKSGVIIAAPIAGGVTTGIAGVRLAKDIWYPSTDQKNNLLLYEEASELIKAKKSLINCLEKNKCDIRHTLDVPRPCRDAAARFGAIAGEDALDKILKDTSLS